MGLSRRGQRPVRARRRCPDLLRSSFSDVAATGSGSLIAPSLRSCCWNAGPRPSAPASPVLSAPPMAASCVENPALQGVGEVILDAPPRRMPAALAAALAAAMLARRRSDPAIGGRMVRHCPRRKPAKAAAPASPIGLVSFPCLADAVRDLDASSSSRPLPPPSEDCSCHEDKLQVVLETVPGLSITSPRAAAAAPASNTASLNGMAGSKRRSSCCFQGNGDWRSCFTGSPRHPRRTGTAPRQLDPPLAADLVAGPRRPNFITRSAPPAWLRDRCFRCLYKGHQVRTCRDPVRCMSCLQSGHITRNFHGKYCMDQSSPVRHVAPPSAPSKEDEGTPTSESIHSVLAEQAELLRFELQGCLARVESFLARAEISLGRLPVVPISAPLDGSPDSGEVDLFGCFSPRGRASIEIVAPVLKIMPELLEMCGKPNSPASMMHLKVNSLEASAVPLPPTPTPLEPTQPLAFVEQGGLDVVVPHSLESTRGEVVVSVALTHVPGALFAGKFCDFLASLEADDPGSGKTIGCLLKERTIRKEMSTKKVGSSSLNEKSFKNKGKKSGSLRKMSATA